MRDANAYARVRRDRRRGDRRESGPDRKPEPSSTADRACGTRGGPGVRHPQIRVAGGRAMLRVRRVERLLEVVAVLEQRVVDRLRGSPDAPTSPGGAGTRRCGRPTRTDRCRAGRSTRSPSPARRWPTTARRGRPARRRTPSAHSRAPADRSTRAACAAWRRASRATARRSPLRSAARCSTSRGATG